ncbi:MAG TPA: C25 family cysteine peptidase, partial [Bacteroidales bacterium]|nr:C25 family cysteine peptidase [Bacteroidales bacterium]
MKARLLFFVLMTIIVSGFSYGQSIRFALDFSTRDFQLGEIDSYTVINPLEPTCFFREIPGYPSMPMRVITLAIPADLEFEGCSIDAGAMVVAENIRVYPTQYPVPTDGTRAQWVGPDPAVYDRNDRYPRDLCTYTGTHDQRQYRYITLEVSPFFYYPKEGKLEILNQAVLEVRLKPGKRNTNPPDDGEVYSLLSRLVDNPESLIAPGAKSPVNPNDVQYLIITDNSLVDAFQPLADWKTQKGIPAEILTTQTIFSSWVGATDQLKLKACLQDYYQNKGLKWVLLGGDDTHVPDQDCYGWVNTATPTEDNTIPADLFYGCFDNQFDWNADGDNRIGEPEDNIDMAPELFIGRAPVQTDSQAAVFVNKTLQYEKVPPQNSFATEFVSSGIQLWNTWDDHSDADWRSEAMWSEVIAPAWSGTKYSYYDTGTDFPGGNMFDVTASNTVNVLNSGYNYFWMATHGGQQVWAMESGDGFSSFDAGGLMNQGRQGLVITMACNTNAFETSLYGNDPCLSEAFLRNGNGGAVMYHGSSRYGWGNGSPGIQHGSSLEYARDFFFALFNGNPSAYPQSFGAVSAESKMDNIGNASSLNSFRWLMFSINAMGDPELPLLTANPTPLAVNHPVSLYYEIAQDVAIETGVANARVCLSDDNPSDPLYVYAIADNTGSCVVNVTPAAGYDVTLTVTAPNHYPTTVSIPVVPSNEPYLVLESLTPNTSSGDVTLEAGESVTLDVQLRNLGGVAANNIMLQLEATDPEGFLSLTDLTESYSGSLASGETLILPAAFALDIAMNVTNNYPITLSTGISFTAKQTNWFQTSFYVYSDIFPKYLTAVSGIQQVDLQWYAPFGGWKSYYSGGGWLSCSVEEKAMKFSAADFDLDYPLEIAQLASQFYENTLWNGNSAFRFSIYDATTEALLYRTDWISANPSGYTMHFMDYPITLSGDFYLSVESADSVDGFPTNVVSEPMAPENTHSYSGSSGNWTKAGVEYSHYIYVTDAVNGGDQMLSYAPDVPFQQTQGATDLLSGKGPDYTFLGYNIYRDTQKINSAPLNDNEFSDVSLATGLYAYDVTAVYSEGESCLSNMVFGAALDASTVFYDHFEGTNNWNGDMGCNWSVIYGTGYSGQRSLTDSPEENYENMTDCRTWTSPPVNIMNANANQASVSFFAKFALEADYDTCYFMVSTELNTGNEEVLGFFTGINTDWTEYFYDISPYMGNGAVYFIFRMKTDPLVNEDGIYIDDFRVRVFENGNAPANNMMAFCYGPEVHLTWAPPMAGGEGWFSHFRWNTHYTTAGDEKATYINLAEFGNAYPMKLEKIRHSFYDRYQNLWEGNTRYTFRVYKKNGVDLIFESEQLEAIAWENEYTLPTPLILDDDVLVSVKPVAATGGPWSLFQNDPTNVSRGFEGNSSVGWYQRNGNWSTSVYLTYTSQKSIDPVWGNPGVALENFAESPFESGAMIPVPAEDLANAPIFKGNTALAKNVLGYNIYRDGILQNTSPVTTTWYQQSLPYQGYYTYEVKAVYPAGLSVSTLPLPLVYDEVVVMDPPIAAATDEVTLWFAPEFSCQAGWGNSLEGYPEVRMHSGIGINGTTWNNVIPWEQNGVNGQSSQLFAAGNGLYSITYTPSEYYGTGSDVPFQDQLCMVFNGGDMAELEFGSAWAKEGKAADDYGNCVDIFIPLEFRDTLFYDDFESGLTHWDVTGNWNLTSTEFFSPSHCLTDSPETSYSVPSESSATMNTGVDLSQKANALVEFSLIHFLSPDDMVFVEASNDDFATIMMLGSIEGSDWKPWKKIQYSLNSMLGATNLKVRFRLVTSNLPEDGVYIDNFVIKASEGSFMVAEIIPHSGNGAFAFFANQTASLDVIVFNGGGMPLSNVPVTLTKTDPDNYISITDDNGIIESLGIGEVDTLFNVFSLEVSVGAEDMYPLSLSVGADLPAKAMEWFDFGFYVFSDLYPLNLQAASSEDEVHLSWEAPFSGWYSYQNGGIWDVDWSAAERATLFQAADFSLTYPLYFTTIAHWFSELPDYPWNGNNTFRYNVYDYNSDTLIIQSDWLVATENNYAFLFLPDAVKVDDDFYISVEVQNMTGPAFPSSAHNEGTTYPQSHSRLGTPGAWTVFDNEWITYLFISGDGGVSGTGDDLTIGYEAGNPVRRQPPKLSTDEVRSSGAKSSVIGYNVYRNGTKINTNPVNGYAYSDMGQPYGTYAYATTAVYAEGESCASNVVSGTFLDPDQVYFEDFEENNEEDWNCGWDFTTADAHSGAVSLANAPWGNYADNQDCWVKADPPISLLNVNAESATLSFWAKYELEENVDTCYVELSTDFWSGQRDTIGYFTGFNTTWQEYSFDVSGYIGKSFVWILHMKTNESVNYAGFYIDDVSLRLYGNDYAPARNFEAFRYKEEVHLDWDWPMAGGEGWFSNWRWTNTTYFNPLEKASYIDIAEFGNAYPMQLTKIRHHFMDSDGNNWNGENEFKFRVYEKDGQTLIFESEVLFASDGVYEYVLPQPLELTDDILLTVKPMDVYPTSCYMSDTDNPGHGYLGSADNGWESINGNWATEVYLANSGTKDNISGTWLAAGVELGNTVPSTNPVGKQTVPADVRATLPLFNGNQKLAKSTQGFNVFRNGQQINSALVTNNYFYDTVPHQGVYDYTVKAVYAGGMSVGTVNKSMTVDDVVIMFPMDAAADDEVTLWFDPFYSCESGQSNSLEGSSEVRMHSAIGVNGSGWVNPIEWDDTGYDGTTTYLNAQPQGQYTITYTPSAFYGVNPASDQIYQLEMVFNSGNSTASPWDKEGKAPDAFGGCENIIIPLNFRSVIFADDFESGTTNWELTGTWALTDLEFFTATHSLTDTPNSWYGGTSETSATLSTGVDLSGYSTPVMEFNLLHGLGNGDQLFVEISTDDFASATLMATYNFWNWKPWSHETIDMSLFEDETNVKVRFRLVTDDTDDGDGVFIDDFAIKGFQETTVVEPIPYTQDFTVFPTPDWEQFEGQLTASSVLVPYTGTGTWDGWHEDGFNCSGGSTGAIRGNLYNSSHYYWYITPYIDLGSSPQNIELRFDMAGSNWNSCIQALLQSEDHFAVVISTDGTTWTETNTLIEWESGDTFPVYGETFEVDLTGYSGLVKFGFYHGHNSSATDIEVFIDNVYVGVDDDPLTIAEARLYPIGSQVTVTGIVTNGQELGNIRYFQDATAGIAAYGGSQNGVIFKGDSVTYSGILKDYNGLLEMDPITNMTVIASGVTLSDTANIEPVEVGELYESQLIVIDTAFFVNPSGTFSAGVYSVVGPDADTANCYVRYSTTLIGTDIPSSPVILKGILSQYSPTDPAAGYQIILRDTDDLTPLPLPPISVQAIATLNDVSLSWDVPLTGVIIPGMDGYNIYRAVGHTALFSSATMINPSLVTDQSYLDQDLANNDYSYWIEAVYGDGEIAISGRITVAVNNYVNVSGYVTLSDLTPVEGVLIHLIRPNGSSGTHTNASGYYSFSNVIPGLDYTVYCEMTGYTFDPDQRAYTSLSVHITDADFTAIPTTISITGNISDYSGGVADVLITFSNEAGTAITNNMGDYYHEVPYNYTGLAMPSKDNFLFTPANRSYDDLITDRTGEDYAATCTLTYLVSGTITDGTLPLEGVLVTLTGSKETTLTGSDGTYSFTVNHGYSGTITPTFANYSFTPAAITLTEVTIDSPGNNFIGTPDAYPVSGTVTWNGQPLEGVLLNFESISNDPTTASDGT